MAIFFDAPVEPDALTAYVREVPLDSTLRLLATMPSRTVDDNTVDFAEITRTNRTARYRSFDGRIHVSERDAGTEKRMRLLPLSSSLNRGEYERLQLLFAQTGGTNVQRLAQAVYDDATQLTREVQNRLEVAWGDVLSDGILNISEGGIGGTAGQVDYGVPGSHKVTVGTSWATVGSATVLSDLEAMVAAYIATNGFAPGAILTSDATLRNMRRNAEVIDAVWGSTAGRTFVRQSELEDLISSELQGLRLLQPYDSQFSVDGVSTRVIPADKVVFLPPNLADLGYTTWGVTATALELVGSAKADLSFEEAAGIVGVVIKDGPPFREYTFVDAVALPVVTNGNLLAILDVAP